MTPYASLRDGLADGFTCERQSSLADFLFAFWKMEIQRPAGGASGVENVVQCGAVIALLAKQLGRCG